MLLTVLCLFLGTPYTHFRISYILIYCGKRVKLFLCSHRTTHGGLIYIFFCNIVLYYLLHYSNVLALLTNMFLRIKKSCNLYSYNRLSENFFWINLRNTTTEKAITKTALLRMYFYKRSTFSIISTEPHFSKQLHITKNICVAKLHMWSQKK